VDVRRAGGPVWGAMTSSREGWQLGLGGGVGRLASRKARQGKDKARQGKAEGGRPAIPRMFFWRDVWEGAVQQ
jgi:hypothetical protein